MPAFTGYPTISPSTLNQFVITMMRNKTNGYSDIITHEKPAHKALERAGAIKDEPRGIGPVRNVKFKQSRRAQFMSASQTTVPRDFAENESLTQAQFYYIAWSIGMAIPEFIWQMTQGPLAQFSYLETQIDEMLQDVEETYNDVLWNGKTVGTHRCFGLKDIIRFDTSTDPAAGAVGGLPVATYPTWCNQKANYNGAFKTLSAGGRFKTMLTYGENSLSSVYRRTTNFKNRGVKGKPDVGLCNEEYMLALEDLKEDGRLAVVSEANNELGTESLRFRGLDLVYDENVPDDPNNSSYGVCYGVNCKDGFNVVYVDGLRRKMSDMKEQPNNEGYYWNHHTYMTTACRHPGLNFVHYGIKPAENV